MVKKKSGGVIITKDLGEIQPEVQTEIKPEIKPEIKTEIKPEVQTEIQPKIKRKKGSLKKKIIKKSNESLSRILPSTTPDILPIVDTKFKFSKKHILFGLFLALIIVGIYKRDFIKEKLLELYFTKIKKFDNESDQ